MLGFKTKKETRVWRKIIREKILPLKGENELLVER